MSKRDPFILLEDILTSIEKIDRYTHGWTREQFVSDDRTSDAVVRNIEIIGEAVRQMPESFREAHPEIPWGQIAGMRNRIVHDYFGVDIEIIWQVISNNLPAFRRRIQDILNSNKS